MSVGMGDTKVSNSISDLQGHSRSLAIVPVDRPHTIVWHCLLILPLAVLVEYDLGQTDR